MRMSFTASKMVKQLDVKLLLYMMKDSKDHWEINKNTADDVIDIQQREES